MPNYILRCDRCDYEVVIAKDDDPDWEPPDHDPEAWVLFGDDSTGPIEAICPRCATPADRQRKTDEEEIAAAHEAIEAERFLDESG